MTTKTCTKCNYKISATNLTRHEAVCDGTPTAAICRKNNRYAGNRRKRYWDIYNLKEIQEFYDAGNSCEEIVKLFGMPYVTITQAAKDGRLKLRTRNETRKLRSYKFKHSTATREKISQIACNRLSKHSKFSKNIEYIPGVILESSYEVKCATLLDKLNIKWVKCREGFVWNDNGNTRRYIPDFYLPDFNIYLDPKNDFLIKKDKIKIESAIELNKICVIILSKNDLTIKKLKQLITASSSR